MNRPIGEIGSQMEVIAPSIAVPPSLEKRRLRAYLALMLGDLVLLHAGFVFAGLIYQGVWMEWRALMQAQLLLPLFYTIALYNSTYSATMLGDVRLAVRKVAASLVISAALLNFVAFYTKSNATFSRGSFTIGLITSFILMAIFRQVVVWAIARLWGGRVRNVLVIQDGGPPIAIEQADVVVAAQAGLAPVRDDPFMLDRLGKLLLNQDKVVVSCPPERREAWAFLLKSSGIRGELVSEGAHSLGALGVVHYDDQDCTSLIVSAGPLGLRSRAAKRCFDLLTASLGLLVLSPVLLCAAVLIRLDDGGPVLFVQRRLGRGNRLFPMLKLRTMCHQMDDPDGRQSTARDDDRVTRIGRFLRRTSLDELPQLWNVIRGDMSIVGPRPHALGSQANNKYFWEVDGAYWKRHSLRPGLTGLAQVRGHRGNTECEQDLADRLQSDLEYIANWSLPGDVAIALKTLSVLRHDNAY